MFQLAILKYVSSKPLIVLQWDENKFVEKLKANMSLSAKKDFDKAWSKMIEEFKSESIKVI